MKRWLLNLAAAVSLILCIGTVILWVRGLYRYDVWQLSGPTRFIHLASGDAYLTLAFGYGLPMHSPPRYYSYGPVSFSAAAIDSGSYHGDRDGLMDSLTERRTSPLRSGIMVEASNWAIATALAVLPALWGLRQRRLRRTKQLGLCANCGYDLRATPDRCPECGAARGKR
jgi:hypothetical protein